MEEFLLEDVDTYVSEELVRPYKDRLLCHVRQFMADHLDNVTVWSATNADPEDIVQQTFERIYVSLRASRKRLTSPFTYLCKTANNTFYDVLRKKREVSTDSLDLKKKFGIEEGETTPIEQSILAPVYNQPEQRMLDQEIVAIIRKAITSIRNESIRTVMLLKCDGSTTHEIMDILNLPEGTVKNYIHRGRAELRVCLEHAEKQGEEIYER